ncbi:MAG: pyruvate kinase [Methanopyri archaeon]|jgi:pyruvate kinase|nr:pyruvate kinase [Methanopyri archaeon]
MDNQKSLTKSKIICTLGPATSSPEQIKKLAELGMDCARIDFSCGTMNEKLSMFKNVRKADESIPIICELQGPKIRIGKMQKGGTLLQPGNKITITNKDVIGTCKKISITNKDLFEDLKQGDLFYINDGIVCLRIETISEEEMECTILSGGFISSRMGVNTPSLVFPFTVPTGKDIQDLWVIADLEPEFVAVSYVDTESDVLAVKKILTERGNDSIKLITKIDRPIALATFDSILEVSDGIMVARGDLGVEIPPEEVLPYQKEMIRKCNIAGKPIIVATQMLESMVKSPMPTRAEISDVFNAIEDGADAVMLSAETASGDYPGEAVEMMERVIRVSEALIPQRNPDNFDSEHETTSEMIGHLVYSACKELSDMQYKNGMIICLTHNGYTGRMVSKYRPSLPILGITSHPRTAREMRLVWGIEPLLIPGLEESEDSLSLIKKSVRACFENNLIERDETLIIAANMLDRPSQTNMVAVFSARDILKEQ